MESDLTSMEQRETTEQREHKREKLILAAFGPVSAVMVGLLSVLGHYYISRVASEREFANWKEKKEIEVYTTNAIRQRELMGEIAELHEKLVVADLEFGIAAELDAMKQAFKSYATEDKAIDLARFDKTIDQLMEQLGVTTEQQVFAKKAQNRTNLSAELSKKFTEADHYFSDNVVNHAANYRGVLYAGHGLSVQEVFRWRDLIGELIDHYKRTGSFDEESFVSGAKNLMAREYDRQVELVNLYNQLYFAMRAEVVVFK
ncbi:hypothetical protein [Thalassospira xiamenensis]|uniref:Uncharacterized protein n=1 Tax=Thalassospira xiamenensis TaxID=220697 RepID=A0A367XHD1_9PROT|nr:hypothetical protein [Thalassospira xiamenensis]KZB56587.1 hypothetical protein AUP41_13095 [Thalassospira xiamenensis]MCK2166789.1 hypothetical protein [Thalassospira xiamenensis]RCK52161.1 hypothetical protein TH44_07095 [Thalassospira xiamenensis]